MEEFINESNNSKYIKTLSVDKYYEYYERLIKLQNNVNEPRIKNDWNILNKYELIAEGDLKYIVKKRTMKKVLNIEDTYIEISDYHINSGHSGRDIMLNYLNCRFYNISRSQIMLVLAKCEGCHLKKPTQKKKEIKKRIGLVHKPILTENLNCQVQISLIDMQSTNERYKFILHYQDHFTKFCILRPLMRKTAEMVIEVLRSIFDIFGSPKLLQTDNGHEFKNKAMIDFLN